MSCIYMLLLLIGHICLFFMESVLGAPLGPQIRLTPPTGEVTQGQNFNITCYPQPHSDTIDLEFNGSNITLLHSVHNDSVTFLFKANSSHSGNYSCVFKTTGPSGHYNISRSEVVAVHVTVNTEVQRFASMLVLTAAASAGGVLVLLLVTLLCFRLTRKPKAQMQRVVLRSYLSQPIEGEDLDSEPVYEEPSEGSNTCYTNMEKPGFRVGCSYADAPSYGSTESYINVEIPGLEKRCSDVHTPSEGSSADYVNVPSLDEEESECEGDYVNTETMGKCDSPVSDSEPDYENAAN